VSPSLDGLRLIEEGLGRVFRLLYPFVPMNRHGSLGCALYTQAKACGYIDGEPPRLQEITILKLDKI